MTSGPLHTGGDNVVILCPAKSSPEAAQVKESSTNVGGNVANILNYQKPAIYYENISKNSSEQAIECISSMIQSGEVKVLTRPTGMDSESVIEVVSSTDGAVYQILASSFVPILQKNGRDLAEEEYEEVLQRFCDRYGIRLGIFPLEEQNTISQNISLKTALTLEFEKKLAYHSEGQDYDVALACKYTNEDEQAVSLMTFDVYDFLPEHFKATTVLDLLVLAYVAGVDEMQNDSIQPSEYFIHIQHNVENETYRQILRFEELKELIRQSIIRRYPIYSNFRDQTQIIDHHYQKHVEQKLLPLDDIDE